MKQVFKNQVFLIFAITQDLQHKVKKNPTHPFVVWEASAKNIEL